MELLTLEPGLWPVTLPDGKRLILLLLVPFTNLQTNEVKKIKTIQFVFVPSTSVFDSVDACNSFYNLSFRIVRFKIADDKYENIGY